MRVIVTTFALSITLGGAQAAPKTPDSIRADFPPAIQLCRTEAPEEIGARMLAGWSRCFAKTQPPGVQAMLAGKVPILVPAGVGSVTSVRVEHSSEATTLVSEGTGAVGIMMIADIRKTESCNTEVQVRGATRFINSIAAKAARFAEDPEARCPADDR